MDLDDKVTRSSPLFNERSLRNCETPSEDVAPATLKFRCKTNRLEVVATMADLKSLEATGASRD